MWNRIVNLKSWQKAILISFLIILPISAGIGWILFSPNFLSNSSENNEEDNINQTGNEENNRTILLTGQLNAIDGSHYGSGTVRIIQEENNSLNLYFINVDIAIGPDLYIYLSNKGSFSGTGDNPGTYYDLGILKQNEGNFTVNIPQEVNIEDYHSILIYCKLYSVLFSWAFLQIS